MSHPVNDQIYDELRDRREQFLEEHGKTEADVKTNSFGEYILVDSRMVMLPSIRDYQGPEGE